jgi:hypothetical protein
MIVKQVRYIWRVQIYSLLVCVLVIVALAQSQRKPVCPAHTHTHTYTHTHTHTHTHTKIHMHRANTHVHWSNRHTHKLVYTHIKRAHTTHRSAHTSSSGKLWTAWGRLPGCPAPTFAPSPAGCAVMGVRNCPLSSIASQQVARTRAAVTFETDEQESVQYSKMTE